MYQMKKEKTRYRIRNRIRKRIRNTPVWLIYLIFIPITTILGILLFYLECITWSIYIN